MSEHIEEAIAKARNDLTTWVYVERMNYADNKYDAERIARFVLDLANDPHQVNPQGTWADFIHNYIIRAGILGFDSLSGRQALGKAIAALQHLTEGAIVAFGPMPKPGVPSGEVQ